MSVNINSHKTHRQDTGGKENIEVQGRTIGQCIQQLIGQYPEMEKNIFAGDGKLKNNIEIYLNMESAYPDELKKPTKDGDEIHITVMLAGG